MRVTGRCSSLTCQQAGIVARMVCFTVTERNEYLGKYCVCSRVRIYFLVEYYFIRAQQNMEDTRLVTGGV